MWFIHVVPNIKISVYAKNQVCRCPTYHTKRAVLIQSLRRRPYRMKPTAVGFISLTTVNLCNFASVPMLNTTRGIEKTPGTIQLLRALKMLYLEWWETISNTFFLCTCSCKQESFTTGALGRSCYIVAVRPSQAACAGKASMIKAPCLWLSLMGSLWCRTQCLTGKNQIFLQSSVGILCLMMMLFIGQSQFIVV